MICLLLAALMIGHHTWRRSLVSVLQVARGQYASKAYHDSIDFTSRQTS